MFQPGLARTGALAAAALSWASWARLNDGDAELEAIHADGTSAYGSRARVGSRILLQALNGQKHFVTSSVGAHLNG